MTRPELAYSLVSALGLQGVAEGYTGDVFATFQGERIRLADSNQIPAEYRGYVQLALDAGLLNATFSIVNTIPGPVVMARFGQTKRDQLAHSVETLRAVGAPLLGSVFTMIPPRGTTSYNYGYGYYGEDAGVRR